MNTRTEIRSVWMKNIVQNVVQAIAETRPPERDRSQETPVERYEILLGFRKSHEDLVAILQDALHYGPMPDQESRYQSLRNYLAASYLSVQPFVLAYLKVSTDDEGFGIRVRGRGTDAFEALWVADSLVAALDADNGTLGERILRTREALNLYHEHLRYLVSKDA